jgi:hypothetical protein
LITIEQRGLIAKPSSRRGYGPSRAARSDIEGWD